MNTVDVASLPPPRKKSFARRHWGKLTLLILVTVPILTLVLWSYAALGYTYSSGNRVGWVQKISSKGWVCKTWEGELQMSNIPGSAPILFPFTVRSDSIANAIERSVGRQWSCSTRSIREFPFPALARPRISWSECGF
jgi:hypothetical protein